jgi:predicted MPP superfamily phosphohydrolase
MTKKNIWWLSILIGFLIYAGLIEPYWIGVKTYDLTIEGFPEEPVCIVHIADTHTSSVGLRERRLVKIVGEIKPDYVFITGDLLMGHSSLTGGLSFISMLKVRKGVYAVCGNADTAVHSARNRGTLYEKTPHVKFLFNESIECGEFTLVGVDDPVTYRARPKDALRDVDGSGPVIALTHFHPDDLLEDLRKGGVDLVLSGHTHGGQLGIPALVHLIPYASRSDYVHGFFDLDGLYLNVTKGIGTNIFPFRFLCRPQVDVFYISGGPAGAPRGNGE